MFNQSNGENMNLKEYIESPSVDINLFCYECGISISSIYRYIKGSKPNLRVAKKIELYTKGKVTVKDLRGDE